MIVKAKESVGVMPHGNIRKYGVSPVAGRENKVVWPDSERGSFRIVKGESYNVSKEHPFFDSVSGSKKVSDDNSPSPDKGKGSGNKV